MSIVSLKTVKASSGSGSPESFLEETLTGLDSLLGPFTSAKNTPKSTKYGSAVVFCKAGKARELIKFLEQQDFTTVDRPVAFISGGMRLESSGEKTFINYNAALGVLLIGTTITKNLSL